MGPLVRLLQFGYVREIEKERKDPGLVNVYLICLLRTTTSSSTTTTTKTKTTSSSSSL
jgi:hypothetical protein